MALDLSPSAEPPDRHEHNYDPNRPTDKTYLFATVEELDGTATIIKEPTWEAPGEERSTPLPVQNINGPFEKKDSLDDSQWEGETHSPPLGPSTCKKTLPENAIQEQGP